MKKIAVAVLTMTALGAPAFAGGPVVVEAEPVIVPAPAPVVYGADWSGFYAGGQLGYADASTDGGVYDGNGGTYGVHAGYRWDLGNTVLGVEADWDKVGADLGVIAGDELDSIARLKLVAGYDMGQTLVYGTAGAAKAKGTVNGADFSENGWSLGAGVTYAINDQWTVGGEVLKNKFGDVVAPGSDLDATTATLRVGFKF